MNRVFYEVQKAKAAAAATDFAPSLVDTDRDASSSRRSADGDEDSISDSNHAKSD
jgi:hypothetical protein